ncbi:MAG: OmpA family protein [Bacteroidia bacterium]|nr:OmpA family protein [Bacteroidia bacterium]
MKKYKELETAKAVSEQKLEGKVADCETRNSSLLTTIAELEGRRAFLENQISALIDSLTACREELAENEAFIKSLGDQLDDQKRKLAAELETKNKMLQQKEIELNNAMARAEAERANVEKLRSELEKTSDRVKKLERELNNKDSAVLALKEEISKALSGFDALDIQVENRNGKVYVSMAEKLLFKSGSITVDPKGKEALVKLAAALNKKADVQVTVEGHTDNKPMNSEKIKDNWDLSVLRATSIVRILTQDGTMNGSRITANGRGDTQPVASNDTPEGRALNRRTEIILTPRLDKILDIINSN